MKKIIIVVAVIVAIAIAGYFGLNQGKQAVAEFGDKQLKTLVEQNLNKAIPIPLLNKQLRRADLTITEFDGNIIKSIVTLKFADDLSEIPLISEIKKGKFQYGEKSFGYGKIVTRLDISQIDELPSFIKKDTLTNTTYIGLDGSLTNTTAIAPIKKTDEIYFKGLTAVINNSLASTSIYDINIQISGMDIKNDNSKIKISPFEITLNTDTNQKYKGISSPLSIDIYKKIKLAKINIGEGRWEGVFKTVSGLDTYIGKHKVLLKNVSLVIMGVPIFSLNNLEITEDVYENEKDKVDLTYSINSDIDLKTLTFLADIPVSPKSISINYNIKNIGFEVINTFIKKFNELLKTNELQFSNEDTAKIIKSLQKTGVEFVFDTTLKTLEGDAYAKINAVLSKVGKSIKIDELEKIMQLLERPHFLPNDEDKINETFYTFFDADIVATIAQKIIEATSSSSHMKSLGAKQSEGKYTLEASLKDGEYILNGKLLNQFIGTSR